MNETCASINCTNMESETTVITCKKTGAKFILNLCSECFKDHTAAVLDNILKEMKKGN